MLIPALHRPQHTVRLRLAVVLVAAAALLLAVVAQLAGAQGEGHDHTATAKPGHSVEANAKLHMLITPAIRATAADSVRAARVAATLRNAIAKYRDTTAAVADGYVMFLPKVKEQKVYHFTNRWRAMQEAFRFDPARPTSLLYEKAADGRFVLTGAMYTAPKRLSYEQLDARVPLSIARWHQHVNWCLPKRGENARWLERRDGEPLFGPESPVATRAACDAVGGRFHETLFGWMLHANVFAGDDPSIVWGDEHGGHDAHAMMQMDHAQ